MRIFNFNKKQETRQETKISDLFEERPKEETFSLEALFGTTPEMITRAQVENIVPVASGVDLIASMIASLPIELYKKTPKGIEKVSKDKRLALLNVESNSYSTATEMKKAMLKDYLYEGSGYLHIKKQGNKYTGLDYIARNHMSYLSNYDVLNPQYKYLVQGKTVETFDLVSIKQNSGDNFLGQGILDKNQDLLQTINYQNGWSRDIAKSRGAGRIMIKVLQKVSEPALKAIKQSYENMYANADSGAIVVNSDTDISHLSANYKDMEVSMSVNQNVKMANALLNIPDAVVSGTATDEVFNNFVTTTIVPLLSVIETALCQSMLLESEKGKLFFKISTDGLLKGNAEKRYNSYEKALKNGIMTVNEVRAKENMLELDNIGDNLKLNLADALYDVNTQELLVLNTGVKTKFGEPIPSEEVPPVEENTDKSDILLQEKEEEVV